jgi:glycyl-tRNA synthetase beta chain
MIKNQVEAVTANAGGKSTDNPDLLEEVAFLLEYPTAFYGEFSPSYLAVPPEVLTTTMINNQRYFPVFDENNQLLPGFIGVRNGTDYRLDLVKAGNERVLKARLEDALFFWKEDNKKPLHEFVNGLKDVLFHERLGTIMDKVTRLQNLAVFIGRENGLSDEETINRAAYLCKADLLTSMVFEFTELQGIMGRYYAKNSGEKPEVSEAIFEHYLPRFAGDILPSSPAGIALSLAEKIDNLVGCFCIGIKPTGSQDPYALRRQALGIVNIILDKGLKVNLEDVVSQAYLGFLNIKPD